MSDIVKCTCGASKDDCIDCMTDEIERLRSVANRGGHLAVANAEIERLRGLVEECAVFLKEDETPAQRIERERADTEAVLKLLLKEKRRTQKLQDKIDRWQGDAECLGRSLTERNAEIERLRLQIYDDNIRIVESPIVKKRDAEIERLRARLKWFEYAGGVAVTTKVHQQHAEIERLRGLLREAQENTTSDGLWLRIEEAIGDGDKE